MESKSSREFDLVLWGATGFTGRLVAAYLHERYGTSSFRWALGGRSREKLEELREDLGAPSLGLFVGDALDPTSMRSLARSAEVVCTTVGPYARLGSELVQACAVEGADYCDLAGEVGWVRKMRQAHQETARGSGARVVNSCGFDSIPSDLGVFFVQREARERWGAPSPAVHGALASASGGISGGTAASMLQQFEAGDGGGVDGGRRAGAVDPAAGALARSSAMGRLYPHYHETFDSWTAPFPTAPVNGSIVRCSAERLEHLYGSDMRYQETLLTGSGLWGAAKATGVTLGLGLGLAAMTIGPVRRLVAQRLPQPGEGPDPEQRRNGHWEMQFVAEPPEVPGAIRLHATVRHDLDPGYGSTARMLGESAASLVLDRVPDRSDVGGGFHTPAVAMGPRLLERLQSNAGLVFEVREGRAR